MPPCQVTEAGYINMAAVDKLRGTAQVDKGIVLLKVVGTVAHMAAAGTVAAPHVAAAGTIAARTAAVGMAAHTAAAGTAVHMAVAVDL